MSASLRQPVALPPDVWQAHTASGTQLYHLCRFADAERAYHAAWELARRGGHADSRLATSLGNLAELYRAWGRLGDAEPLARRALAMRERTLPPEHPHIATSLHNLVRVLIDAGRWQEALPLQERAVLLFRSAGSAAAGDLAASLRQLASLHCRLGELVKARAAASEAEATRRERSGSEHPEALAGVLLLARIDRLEGRFGDAVARSREGVEGFERVFGPRSPQVASALSEHGLALCADDQAAAAEGVLRRALRIDSAVLGRAHPATAASLQHLAWACRRLGRLRRAEMLLRRATSIHQPLLGEFHPDTLLVQLAMADVIRLQGRVDQARRAYERVLPRLIAALGEAHPDVAVGHNNLALTLALSGRLAEAAGLLDAALDCLAGTHGQDHPLTRLVAGNLQRLRSRGGAGSTRGGAPGTTR